MTKGGKHNITIQISADKDVPDIYVNGERAHVVTCSYMYVTKGPYPEGSNQYSATIILGSDKEFMQHALLISDGECVFYQ